MTFDEIRDLLFEGIAKTNTKRTAYVARYVLKKFEGIAKTNTKRTASDGSKNS